MTLQVTRSPLTSELLSLPRRLRPSILPSTLPSFIWLVKTTTSRAPCSVLHKSGGLGQVTAGPALTRSPCCPKSPPTFLTGVWREIAALSEVGLPSLRGCQVRTIAIRTASPFPGRTPLTPAETSQAPQRGCLRRFQPPSAAPGFLSSITKPGLHISKLKGQVSESNDTGCQRVLVALFECSWNPLLASWCRHNQAWKCAG